MTSFKHQALKELADQQVRFALRNAGWSSSAGPSSCSTKSIRTRRIRTRSSVTV